MNDRNTYIWYGFEVAISYCSGYKKKISVPIKFVYVLNKESSRIIFLMKCVTHCNGEEKINYK